MSQLKPEDLKTRQKARGRVILWAEGRARTESWRQESTKRLGNRK